MVIVISTATKQSTSTQTNQNKDTTYVMPITSDIITSQGVCGFSPPQHFRYRAALGDQSDFTTAPSRTLHLRCTMSQTECVNPITSRLCHLHGILYGTCTGRTTLLLLLLLLCPLFGLYSARQQEQPPATRRSLGLWTLDLANIKVERRVQAPSCFLASDC